MNDTREQRYYPGQVSGLYLKRRHVLIAQEGPLRIQYRDKSLDWLLSDAPSICITLLEGECYVLPYAAFVEVSVVGSKIVTGLIKRPMRFRTWLDRRFRAFALLRQCHTVRNS